MAALHAKPANRPRIAVVDDEDSVRKSLSRLLRAEGMDVDTFGSASEFLLAPAPRFDCLVLDVHMPLMDGFDVYEHFLRVGIRMPVVVVTGHDSPKDRARADNLGIANYLRKPVDGRVLVNAIEGAMRAAEKTR